MNTTVGFCWTKASDLFRKDKDSAHELRNRCFLLVDDSDGRVSDAAIDVLIELWEENSTCYCRRTTLSTTPNLLKAEDVSLWFRGSTFPVKPDEDIKEIQFPSQKSTDSHSQRIIVEVNGKFLANLDYGCVKRTGVA